MQSKRIASLLLVVGLYQLPPDHEAALFNILEPQVDSPVNCRSAVQKVRLETESLRGRDLSFAWYNLGTNLLNLAV